MYSIENEKIELIKLHDIVARLNDVGPDVKLVCDSRQVAVNSIFCAYPGVSIDGRDFISQALKLGARGILWEKQNFSFKYEGSFNIPVLNLRDYLGLIASELYLNPSSKLAIIGITGTNGKTSIANFLFQAYNLLKTKVGVMGTIWGSGLTTSDPLTLQDYFYQANLLKKNKVVMEVSSHALTQGRVNGTQFKTAIFTNLTQDHLDYHLNMENYYLAKRSLFYWQDLQNCIINIDDPYGLRLYKELTTTRPGINILTYGVSSTFANLKADEISLTESGTSFILNYNDLTFNVALPLLGKFNVYNILASIGALLMDGYMAHQIMDLLPNLISAIGRMQTLRFNNSPLVVVDYAHTPDALEKTILALREIKHYKKIYCVFGCGGDRDKLKRPLMGKIATSNADFVIITNDNPRFEEPEIIVKNIISGINKANYQVVSDRKEAITQAITQANSNDIVLIAGKGHEEYQEFMGEKYHFSDIEVAKSILMN